jgi:hypothetical protein
MPIRRHRADTYLPAAPVARRGALLVMSLRGPYYAENPPDLPRLLASANPADRVQVQQTAFSYDVIGRYVCNDWGEVTASLADGGFPFDVVVVGAGMYGGYCAEKLYRLGAGLGLRILVLDAGATLFATHIQNLPQRLGGNVGGPAYNRTREDGTGTQNVVWGMP